MHPQSKYTNYLFDNKKKFETNKTEEYTKMFDSKVRLTQAVKPDSKLFLHTKKHNF